MTKCDDHEFIECDVTLLVPREHDVSFGYLWGDVSAAIRRDCLGVLTTARFDLTPEVVEALRTTEGVGRLKAFLRDNGVKFRDVVSVTPCEYEMGFYRS